MRRSSRSRRNELEGDTDSYLYSMTLSPSQGPGDVFDRHFDEIEIEQPARTSLSSPTDYSSNNPNRIREGKQPESGAAPILPNILDGLFSNSPPGWGLLSSETPGQFIETGMALSLSSSYAHEAFDLERGNMSTSSYPSSSSSLSSPYRSLFSTNDLSRNDFGNQGTSYDTALTSPSVSIDDTGKGKGKMPSPPALSHETSSTLPLFEFEQVKPHRVVGWDTDSFDQNGASSSKPQLSPLMIPSTPSSGLTHALARNRSNSTVVPRESSTHVVQGVTVSAPTNKSQNMVRTRSRSLSLTARRNPDNGDTTKPSTVDGIRRAGTRDPPSRTHSEVNLRDPVTPSRPSPITRLPSPTGVYKLKGRVLSTPLPITQLKSRISWSSPTLPLLTTIEPTCKEQLVPDEPHYQPFAFAIEAEGAKPVPKINIFDGVLPVETRLSIFHAVVQSFVEEHERRVQNDEWTVAKAGETRWVGWEAGIRELVKISRVNSVRMVFIYSSHQFYVPRYRGPGNLWR